MPAPSGKDFATQDDEELVRERRLVHLTLAAGAAFLAVFGWLLTL